MSVANIPHSQSENESNFVQTSTALANNSCPSVIRCGRYDCAWVPALSAIPVFETFVGVESQAINSRSKSNVNFVDPISRLHIDEILSSSLASIEPRLDNCPWAISM